MKETLEKLSYIEVKNVLRASRGVLVEMLDLALEHGDITQKQRDVAYFRDIEWNSLENCGKKFGVTRERIRQMEAKTEEIMRHLTKV